MSDMLYELKIKGQDSPLFLTQEVFSDFLKMTNQECSLSVKGRLAQINKCLEHHKVAAVAIDWSMEDL